MTFKVSSFNVNSIKSRLNILSDWIKETGPDIIMLQEAKCIDSAFPYESIEDLGYNIAYHGQKSYNGVAILSKSPIEEVKKQFPGNPDHHQARFIEVDSYLGDELYKIINVYVPNGQSPESEKFLYKLSFLEKLYQYLKELISLDQKIIIGGDFNVALTELDVFDHVGLEGSICYNPREREIMRKIINLGYTDIYRELNNGVSKFSWWDYRASSWQQNKGMRIDYLLLNHQACERIVSASIEDSLRALPTPSDHVPVSIILA